MSLKKALAIPVRLPGRRYEVRIREGLLDEVHLFLAELPVRPQRIALITDSNVDRWYGERVARSLSRYRAEVTKIELAPGEKTKSLSGLADLYEAFADAGLDRSSLVVALGGGVVGDLAGFAAATFLRGLPYLQIPTSLLAQLDSSVGGKTGIDLPWGKNLAGAFHQPLGVLIDPETLVTLPPRELRNGLAEAIKAAVIADAALFEFLEKRREEILTIDTRALVRTIAGAVRIKARIVEKDERESGPRMLLNFGHTIGHAIEAAKNYEGILHGEAVAIGMAAAAILSVEAGKLAPKSRDRFLKILHEYGLPTQLPAELDLEKTLSLMGNDKKRAASGLRFVLLSSIGRAEVVSNIDIASVRRILAILR